MLFSAEKDVLPVKEIPWQYLVFPEDTASHSAIGEKGRALAVLSSVNAPVPSWFAVTPNAFYDSLAPGQHASLRKKGRKGSFENRIVESIVPFPAFETELKKALSTFCANGQLVAVRASALAEDNILHSFAGQLSSYLFVSPEDVLKRIVAVWASGFTPQVLEYRKAHGFNGLPDPPAIIIQQMVHADVSGVAFSADPISGNRNIKVISAHYGLGITSRLAQNNSDIFKLDEFGEVEQTIAIKTRAAVYQADAEDLITTIPVPENVSDIPCLQEGQIKLLGQWADYLSHHFGTPQDLEWSIAQGELFILQSRPIRTLLRAEQGGNRKTWTNIHLESWPGVVTPLTYSLLQRIYNAQFKWIARIFQVSSRTILAQEALFGKVLGTLYGRVFYNVESLQEIWSLSGTYRRYKRWFIEFIGDYLPDDQRDYHPQSAAVMGGLKLHAIELMSCCQTTFFFMKTHLLWSRKTDTFFKHIRNTLLSVPNDFNAYDLSSLIGFYYRLESIFFKYWGIPTLNDFFASFFYTLLGKCTRRWCLDENETLKNDLLCLQQNIHSVTPIRHLYELANLALETSETFVTHLCEMPLRKLLTEIEGVPDFKRAYQNYLTEYGNRCHEDLKLESPNIQDDPLILLRAVGQLARQRQAQKKPSSKTMHPNVKVCQAAEGRIEEMLQKKPLHRFILKWLLRNTRETLRHRENMRFELTRLIGCFRSLFLAIGIQLAHLGVLEKAQDIFYLDIQDVLGYVEGTVYSANLKSRAALNKTTFKNHVKHEDLPNPLMTYGIPYQSDISTPSETASLTNEAKASHLNEHHGLACSPGIVKGPIYVLTPDQENPIHLTGQEILIAPHGAPGLAMLFPSVSGLLFEHGNPLSHLAIVARELGIPTIMSIPGLTQWLQPGDWVEMDGQKGTLKKIPPPKK